MATRQTYVTAVKSRVSGAERLLDVNSLSHYVDQCLPAYSAAAANRGRTRKVELTITGDGSEEYGLGSDWTDGFSTVVEVWRWDDNDTTDQPTRLGSDEYEVEDALPSSGASQIRFLTFSPSSSDRVVVVHTALHTCTDSASTLSAWDDEAFADLVSSRVLEAAATALLSRVPQSTDTDSLIGNPDAERAREYRTSARTLERRFERHFGIGDVDNGPETARAVVITEDLDKGPGILRYRHTHPRRGRGY